MSTAQCFNCDIVHQDVEMRSFDWDMRPRQKDLSRGHTGGLTTFEVDLCPHCYSQVEDQSVSGWDWWDAFDVLSSHFTYEQS